VRLAATMFPLSKTKVTWFVDMNSLTIQNSLPFSGSLSVVSAKI
jgi:hypothetical protein